MVAEKHDERAIELARAEGEASALSFALKSWRIHVSRAGPHDERACQECAWFRKNSRRVMGEIGKFVAVQEEPRQCAREGCGNEFVPKPNAGWQRYCSQRCRQAEYQRRKSGNGKLRPASRSIAVR